MNKLVAIGVLIEKNLGMSKFQEISEFEGQFMETLENEMKKQPWMPVCTPEMLACP